MAKPAADSAPPPIALNKRARHEYFIEETYDAGLSLQGWEVKSLRAGRAQISEAYVLVKDGEAWLFGAHIAPLPTTSMTSSGAIKAAVSSSKPMPIGKGL